MSATIGTVERVNGPVVHLAGLPDVVRFEFVEVGPDHLPGEVIEVDDERAVAQVYEDTGGLTVGTQVRALGHPLTIELGPGLPGGIYDGLLRPLATAGEFLPPRALERPVGADHEFEPAVSVGDSVTAGDVIGHVVGNSAFDHLVLVPPDLDGVVDRIAEPGVYDAHRIVATVDGTPVSLTSEWPIRRPRPVARRLVDRQPFVTGQRVLDLLEPIAIGSAATVIGGFGEGKTMLLEQIAKWGAADIVIYVGCGERGNELADLIDELADLVDPRRDRPLLERTIVLANTSNMPVMAREASIYTAVTIAEYYRDMGLHAVIIADSTSRWAEAQRELASRTGAIPAEQGYPADLPSALAAFYQRSGRVETVGGREGAVTIVTSVSPPGGDVTEPVAAHTQRFVQAVWGLDRDLAYARHYPAVSWRRSFTRDGDPIAQWYAAHDDADWNVRRSRLQAMLAEADRLLGIAELVGVGALPTDERVTLLGARLVRETVLQQSALSPRDAYCPVDKQAALVEAVLDVYDAARSAGRAGVPASVIEQFDLSPLVRAKDEVDAADDVRRVAADLVRTIEHARPDAEASP